MASSKLDVTGDLLLQKVTAEWQPVDPIIDALIPTVAPGMAMRRYNNRTRTRVERGDLPIRELSDRDKQTSGARSIVQDRIGSQKRAGRIEVADVDGVRCIRFNPDAYCSECRRPFETAATKQPQSTSRRTARQQTKVVYPKFPQWERTTTKAAGDGGSE